jgi:hypothetical protein
LVVPWFLSFLVASSLRARRKERGHGRGADDDEGQQENDRRISAAGAI